MEGDFQLPNGHLLNLNPRPRNNSKSNRQPPITANSKLPQSRERVPSNGTEGKTSTRLDPNTMPQTSPSGLATKLPLPKSFMDKGKGKGKWKDKQPYVEDEEEEKDERPKSKPCHKSDTTPTISENTPEKSTEKNHDHHWSKIRGKLDKDSPLLQKSKEKQKEYYQGAYQKIKSFANGPRNEIPKNKKYGEVNVSDTKLPTPGTTGIPSPSNRARSASGGITRAPAIRQPPKQKKQQQQQQKDEHPAPLQIKKSPSRQPSEITDNKTDSSAYSQFSTSSASGRASSNTEWEDKFVVNMPSATEPNPPFLTAQQIVEFQKSMEKVRREGGDMVHPDTCPSPRITTPEGKTDTSKTSECDDSNPETKKQDKTNANNTNPLQPGRYYSPEEIGKKRCSTIWEEAPSKAKQKNPDTTPDGSFLGCKEIGPGEKNPDEILFFSTTTERPKVVDISAPISRKPRAKTKPTGRRVPGDMDDNIMAYREWRSLSDNLMNGQRSKQAPKTMCQEPVCQSQEKSQAPKTSGKENSRKSLTADSKDNPKEDDIFMNTATVSRAPVTASGKTRYKISSSSQLPQSNSQTTGDSTPTFREPISRSPPSGLQRGIPKPREKNDDNQNTPSKSPSNITNISVNKTRGKIERNSDSPRGIRGIMRFPGMGKLSTEQSPSTNKRQSSMPVPMSKGSSGEKRSISGQSLVNSEPASKSVSPVSSIIPEENHKASSTRIVDAELDGEAKQTAQDATADSPDNVENSDNEDAAYPLTLALLFDILILSITYIQRLSSEFLGNEYPQVILQSVMKMLEHCAHVSRHVSLAFSTYKSTGSWPKSGNGDLCDSLTDIAQAAVYLISLGFMMIIIGRAAGYVVIVGSWVVWMAKPFGWALGLVARALVP